MPYIFRLTKFITYTRRTLFACELFRITKLTENFAALLVLFLGSTCLMAKIYILWRNSPYKKFTLYIIGQGFDSDNI